jgi:hypothetical protein
MGFFGFGKKKDVLDLTERYKRQQEKISEMEGDSSSSVSTDSGASSSGGFGIFGAMASANSSTSSGSDSTSSGGYVDVAGSSGVEDKRKKLVKRIMAMTEKLEDLGNQIYHLQQRIEVLEKKSGANRF